MSLQNRLPVIPLRNAVISDRPEPVTGVYRSATKRALSGASGPNALQSSSMQAMGWGTIIDLRQVRPRKRPGWSSRAAHPRARSARITIAWNGYALGYAGEQRRHAKDRND